MKLFGFKGTALLCLLPLYLAFASAGIDPGINSCSSNPCLNSGICTYTPTGFICTCVNGYIGLRCERRSDECTLADSLLCANGHCRLNSNGRPRCECNANYGGRNCNQKLNTCQHVSCNGGTCIDAANGYECKCPKGFHGKNCQINNLNTAKCLMNCNATISGTNGRKCWHNASEVIKVGWGYKQPLCSTQQNCFDTGSTNVDYIDVQLKPVQAQPNDKLVFLTDVDASLYNNNFIPHVIPVEAASSDAFTNCNLSHAIPIANFSSGNEGEILVNASYMHSGTQYFIANVNSLHRCEFGLRLNVTIKENKCHDPLKPDTAMCHSHGNCFTDFTKKHFECSCCDGFVGKYCDNEDPCLINPCQNNGKCNIVTDQEGDKTYRCTCKNGFLGFNCNQTINYCDSLPCLNGATCTSGLSGFTCACKNGFSGRFCQVNEDKCASRPCQNGGTCSNLLDFYECKCPNGYKGSLCEVNINDCTPNPCHNGTCIDGIGQYRCHCNQGYTGRVCNESPDQCTSSPCINGKCINKQGSYECSCGIGYTGNLCELKVDLCRNTLFCLEDYSLACIDHGNNVTCSCIDGYSGMNCGVNIDECASTPCQNGGKCVDKVNGYECNCLNGATGANCEVASTTSTEKPPTTVDKASTTSKPQSTGTTTNKKTDSPIFEIDMDLQILTDDCPKLQNPNAIRRLANFILSIIIDACQCTPSNGKFEAKSSLVQCSDKTSGKFVTKMKFRDQKEQELILCSLRERIKKGKVPTTDHNTYIIGLNTNTALCEKKDKDKEKDDQNPTTNVAQSKDDTTGIVIGCVVAVLFIFISGVLISVRYRNRAVRQVKESDDDQVKSFLNFTYQSDVELVAPKSAWNTPEQMHDANRLQYVIKKPKLAETAFSIDNPGGKTSKV